MIFFVEIETKLNPSMQHEQFFLKLTLFSGNGVYAGFFETAGRPQVFKRGTRGDKVRYVVAELVDPVLSISADNNSSRVACSDINLRINHILCIAALTDYCCKSCNC